MHALIIRFSKEFKIVAGLGRTGLHKVLMPIRGQASDLKDVQYSVDIAFMQAIRCHGTYQV
jgi:hypothetical protein